MKFKITMISIISIALTACGIVDTEAANEALDLKAQVLDIQANQIEPILEQLSVLKDEIDPKEQEIEELQDQRDRFYEEGERIWRDFQDEMNQKYEMLFRGGDEARD